jgi:monoamine oxidase
MARTPLMRHVRRMIAAAGRDDPATASTPWGSPFSRRQFLVGTGAVLGAAALGLPESARAATQPRIAIIGAGIAGLTAALRLQDAGYRSTVYEAAGRVGGRMHSDTTSWADGQVSEHCGELIGSGHTTLLGLAQRFGIPVTDLAAAEPNGSTETYWFFNRYYPPSHALQDFAVVRRAVTDDANAAYPTTFDSYNAAGHALDHMSVYDWIERRVPGGHRSSMGALLDVAYNIEYGALTREQSALNVVFLLGFQPSDTGFAVFGSEDERYHMVGGNERLPRAIAGALAEPVRLSTALTAIGRNRDGSYKLDMSSAGSPTTVTAERVILAIPFSVLRHLDYSGAGFDAHKDAAIQQLGYGANGKLHLQFTERLWNENGPWGISTGTTFADTGYQNTWDVSRGQAGPSGILVAYTGVPDTNATVAEGDTAVHRRAQTFLRRLEPVFPGISRRWNGQATFDYPLANPLLRGSYAYWKVGQYTTIAGAERLRSHNCHFAGEHCSLSFQGFMEGAATEGIRAAEEILADHRTGIVP